MAYCEKFKLPAYDTVSNTPISKVEGCEKLTFFKPCTYNKTNTCGINMMKMVLKYFDCGNITHYIDQ